MLELAFGDVNEHNLLMVGVGKHHHFVSHPHEVQTGDILVVLEHLVPKGDLALELVLDDGLLVQQPVEDFVPDLAFLVQESEELVPVNAVLDQGLRHALLDIGRLASLQRRYQLRDCLDG